MRLEIVAHKALALLAYLAVEAKPQPRARLAELFWPTGDPAQLHSERARALAAQIADEDPSTVEEQAVPLEIDYPDVQHDLNRWMPPVKVTDRYPPFSLR